MDTDAKYTSEAIVIDEAAVVSEAALHFLVLMQLPDGQIVLAPTQGKLIYLGETEKGHIWTYLRTFRRPIFVCLYSHINRVDFIQSSHMPPELMERAIELALNQEVYDRRHLQLDGFPTPG